MHTTLIKATVRAALAAVLALTFTPLLAPGQTGVNKYDFNGDGHPDIAFQGPGNQTAIWYLNNNVLLGGLNGPTLPPPSQNNDWIVVDTADFNGDGHPDFLLLNLATGTQTAIWYLNNNVLLGGLSGPTLPNGWALAGIADFNGDGHPDWVLFNPLTRQTAIWYLNNNVLLGGLNGPTLPEGWGFFGIGDFNGDGHPDWVLWNPQTRQTAIWYMNNNVLLGGLNGPTLPPASTGWFPANIADYNGDGHPDYLLQNQNTQQTAIWYLNNNVLLGGLSGPMLPFGWTLVTAHH